MEPVAAAAAPVAVFAAVRVTPGGTAVAVVSAAEVVPWLN